MKKPPVINSPDTDSLRAWRPDRPLRCTCGYHRKGLATDAVCPECGKLELHWTMGSKIYAAKLQANTTARAAWKATIVACVLAALVLLWFIIAMVAAWDSVGMDFGPVLPVLAWILVVAPAIVIAAVLLLIARGQGDTSGLCGWGWRFLAAPLAITGCLLLYFVYMMLFWR